MGLFDKLKSVGKMITGGGAKVYVEVGNASVKQPFAVKVKAVVSDSDLKIDGVYLLIRAEEEVRVSADSVLESVRQAVKDFAADGRLDGVTEREQTCDIRLPVSGPQQLKAGQSYEWETTVSLPSGSAPTFRGRKCQHAWHLQAGLDATGNDPDSGWIEFHVA